MINITEVRIQSPLPQWVRTNAGANAGVSPTPVPQREPPLIASATALGVCFAPASPLRMAQGGRGQSLAKRIAPVSSGSLRPDLNAMDMRLRLCMSALRSLADQPASEFNRVPLGERHIDEYFRAKDASLELLTAAINAEGVDDDFWIMMREYIQRRWQPRRGG